MKKNKRRLNLDDLLNEPKTVSEKFHQKTKINHLLKPIQFKKPPKEWIEIDYKGYVRLDELALPKPLLPKTPLFKKILEDRYSIREFSKKTLSIEKLSSLLFYSAGIKKNQSGKQPFRFYPSAGARYPLEIYLISLNSDLPKGLFHYYLKSHSLEELVKFKRFRLKNYFTQKWILKASCIIIITALFKRMTSKYGDRGYRAVLIEAGHLGQNIYLVSTALNLACCAIGGGGYLDKKIEELLEIDGVKESVVYAFAVGEK